MIGTLLNDRYRLDAELGRGGMGVVYRAHDMLLDRDVAVKVLSSDSLGTEGRARLLREARAVAQLNHPNVVSVYDAGEADGTPFIVMELVVGESLHERRAESLDEILYLGQQICIALEHAHAHGIIHRDLKPENVMLAPIPPPSPSEGEGPGVRVKLADFGLARTPASRLTTEGTILGTVAYLAPEQAMGERLDHRADLYALGVMLYELTTGRLPFAGDDPLAIISQHLYAPVVPPRARNPGIPPLLDALIVRLLSKSPDGRPASAAEVWETLAGPASGVGLPAPVQVAEELSVLDRIVRGRMVGRERELAQAKELWRQVAAGAGQVLLVSGEAGIGKTRLVRELTAQVKVSGGRALVGACYAEGGPPYAALKQIVREVFRSDCDGDLDLPQSVLADLIALVPGLRSRYPEVKPNPPLNDPKAEQYRLFENLVTWTGALSDRAPLLLVIEDIHWAGSGTLFLLRHLARQIRWQGTMIAATYREVDPDEALAFHEVLLDLDRERLATHLKLARLGHTETQELLATLFADDIAPELLDDVYRETEGNPFFIEEVCKTLVESAKLHHVDGRWHWPSVGELEIPQSVRVAIQSRVRMLPPDSQRTLRLAAILGREFDLEALAAASAPLPARRGEPVEPSDWAMDEEALIDALEDAERAQLIERVSGERGGSYAFVHGLFASTLVESTRAVQRRRLHRRVAVAIEALHPDDPEQVPALAYHYEQAGVRDKAVHYLAQAGDHAREAYSNAEAIAFYRAALEQVRHLERESTQPDAWCEQAARLYENLGSVLSLIGQFDEARSAYRDALSQAPKGDRVWRSRLHRKGGNTWVLQSLLQNSLQAYDRAERTLGPSPIESADTWRHEWLEIQLDRAWVYYRLDQISQGTELIDRIRPIVENHGTPVQRAFFFANLVRMASRRGRYVVTESMLADARASLAASKESGDVRVITSMTFVLALCHLWYGELNEAEAGMQAALKLAERTGDLEWLVLSLTYLTVAHRRRGQVEHVRRYVSRSLDAATVGEMTPYIGTAKANLAWLAWCEGNWADVETHGQAALDIWVQAVPYPFQWIALWPLIAVALVQGQDAEAVEHARALLSPTQMRLPEPLEAVLQQAIVAWEGGDASAARARLNEAVDLAQQTGWL